MHQRKLCAFDHAERQRTFHRDRFSIEIGRDVSGVDQRGCAI